MTIRKASILASALAFLAGSAMAQELDFPTWQAEDPSFAPWWNMVIEEFEERHPGVTVNMRTIPFRQYVDQTTVAFAGGNPPDIVHLPSRNFAGFARNGWLMPLDGYLQGTDIVDSWTPLQEGMSWEGSHQGVLLLGYGAVMYINDEIFDAAGIAVPTTVEDTIAAADALTDREAGIFGWGGATTDHPNAAGDILNWIIGQGAKPTENGAYNFTDPETVEAVENYRRAFANAAPGLNSTEYRQLFGDGRIAAYIGGPFDWSRYIDIDGRSIAAVPFPEVPGSLSNSLHIAANADPETAQLVWDFIALTTEPRFQTAYVMQTRAPAPRIGSLSEQQLADNPDLALIDAAGATGASTIPDELPLIENYSEYQNYLVETAIRLQTEDTPTAEILADLQEELERRIPLE
ncbi:MAG: extracellular solute-binding protein [Pseudomonadota bacterium]